MVVFTYVILVFLILRFSVTLFNFLSNPKLGRYGKHFTDKVSILIDAEINQSGLFNLLSSVKNQDYQDIEVIINCGKIAENWEIALRFCNDDDRFRVATKISDYYSAGHGQNFISEANGDFLLFLDADVIIKPGFINSLVYRTKVFNLTLLNIMPTQLPKTILHKILLPINDFVLLNLIPLRLVRLLSSPAFSASSDKCLFFTAQEYRQYQWPRGREIVKAVKLDGLHAETLLGDRLVYVSPPLGKDIWKSCGNNLLLIFGNNAVAAILYLIVVVTGPLYMVIKAEYRLLILPIGLIFLTRIMISFLVKQNPLINVILHPIQMVMLCTILLKAVFMRILTIFK